MKSLFILIFLLFLITVAPQKAFAAPNASGSSAKLAPVPPIKEGDVRAIVLKDFLEKFNSPLSSYAASFIENADKYNLDWRLVAAISGLESTFGKNIPERSYNGWGWGVYGNNVIRFGSWDEGIETVSEGLRKNYIDRLGTDDVYAIGKWYASSPTWAQRVAYFMEKIKEFKNQNLAQSLSISL